MFNRRVLLLKFFLSARCALHSLTVLKKLGTLSDYKLNNLPASNHFALFMLAAEKQSADAGTPPRTYIKTIRTQEC